ncbi:MAG TPA: lytic transglycosylase domain-containing protein [Verrucomicrobiae bacterium]
MKRRCPPSVFLSALKTSLTLFLASSSAPLFAQDTLTLDDMVQSADQWARENLDEDFLKALGADDRRKVNELLEKLQKEFHGEYVIDLAQLKDTARALLPLLESYEETLPYAVWLKTRLDYLDLADQLRILIPPPKPKPGELPKPVSVPPAKVRELWIRHYVDRPVPQQAKPYLTRLKSIFTAEKIPPELVWIAEVESSFDPRARSPAGAAGLFQLMPATAKQYGLRTWPLDQRLKLDASARAAAQHLQRLYSRYRDWRLALAAYNAGEGTVDALLARQKSRSFDAIAARLPAETQLYVPKVEAALRRREGVKLAELPAPGPRSEG